MLAERRQRLKSALNDQDEEVRRLAAQALEHLEALQELDHLLEVAQGAERGLRVQALFALERATSERVFPVLLAALEDGDADIRCAAVQVLGHKCKPDTLGPIVKHLKDPAPAVRVHVVDAMGRFGDPRLVPYRSLGQIAAAAAQDFLLPLLDDPRPKVRREAVSALGVLGI